MWFGRMRSSLEKTFFSTRIGNRTNLTEESAFNVTGSKETISAAGSPKGRHLCSGG